MNLHSFNWYILLTAFLILMVFGILTAVKAASLMKKLKSIQPTVTSIKNKETDVKEISQVVIEKTKLDLKTGIGVVTGIAFLKAIHKDYKQSGSSGMKQVEKSTINVMEEQRKKKMLKNVLNTYAKNRKIA